VSDWSSDVCSSDLSKKLCRDYPRGVWNGFACRRFSVPDALPIAPALPVAFLFAGRGDPVSLLRLPPRPGPRRLPASVAAIALPRVSRPKALLASLEQAPPRPSNGPLTGAADLRLSTESTTLSQDQMLLLCLP